MQKTKDFLKVIPSLLKEKDKLTVWFFTYNRFGIGSHEYIQAHAKGEDGLTIKVSEGDKYGHPDMLAEDLEKYGKIAQRLLNNTDISQAPLDSPLIFVNYIGLQAVSGGLNQVHEFRKARPESVIITVACDCGLREKNQAIYPLLKNGVINYSVINYDCGGYLSMGDILEAIVTQWPSRNNS
jgi:hypothetical protein